MITGNTRVAISRHFDADLYYFVSSARSPLIEFSTLSPLFHGFSAPYKIAAFVFRPRACILIFCFSRTASLALLRNTMNYLTAALGPAPFRRRASFVSLLDASFATSIIDKYHNTSLPQARNWRSIISVEHCIT